MVPKTGASLSCDASIFMLFSVSSVTSVRAMCKPCATGIRIRVIAVRWAFNDVEQKDAWPVLGRLVPSASDVETWRVGVSAR